MPALGCVCSHKADWAVESGGVFITSMGHLGVDPRRLVALAAWADGSTTGGESTHPPSPLSVARPATLPPNDDGHHHSGGGGRSVSSLSVITQGLAECRD